MGIYTSPERVVRGGVLIAFAGEVMSDEEARSRGLIAETEPENPNTGDYGSLTVAELRALIADRGGEAPKGAKKAELVRIAGAL